MKLTDISRAMLSARREIRDHERDGWERIGEGGGKLWELHRGGRWNHIITDVEIAADGKSLWIKTAPAGREAQKEPSNA